MVVGGVDGCLQEFEDSFQDLYHWTISTFRIVGLNPFCTENSSM
jgi:hypothetical protein